MAIGRITIYQDICNELENDRCYNLDFCQELLLLILTTIMLTDFLIV